MKTFDEWYAEKHGDSFESINMQPFSPYERTLREFLTSSRQYLSECMKELEEKKENGHG